MRMAKVLSGVYRTRVFSSRQTSLSDLHRFCQDICRHDTCCHGYVVNQNSLKSGLVAMDTGQREYMLNKNNKCKNDEMLR